MDKVIDLTSIKSNNSFVLKGNKRLTFILGNIKNQKMDYDLIFHIQKYSNSIINFRVGNIKNSDICIKCTINTPLHSTNSKAVLNMKGIITDSNSYIVFKPYLQVEEITSNIQHKISIGYLDEDYINYLCSRGLTKKQSENLFIKYFLK
jgi:Fe-S cluster assembly scaffold protein SufB